MRGSSFKSYLKTVTAEQATTWVTHPSHTREARIMALLCSKPFNLQVNREVPKVEDGHFSISAPHPLNLPPHLLSSSFSGLFPVPQTLQAYSFPRTFALAISSAWDIFPLNTLQLSAPMSGSQGSPTRWLSPPPHIPEPSYLFAISVMTYTIDMSLCGLSAPRRTKAPRRLVCSVHYV